MKNEKNTTVGTNPKFNRTITERGKTDTTRIHIHDHSIYDVYSKQDTNDAFSIDVKLKEKMEKNIFILCLKYNNKRNIFRNMSL
jgi:hypothetical protein